MLAKSLVMLQNSSYNLTVPFNVTNCHHSNTICHNVIISSELISHMILDIYIVANEDEKQFALKLHR